MACLSVQYHIGSDLDRTEAIIDDIILWGITEDEHDKHLKALMVRVGQQT